MQIGGGRFELAGDLGFALPVTMINVLGQCPKICKSSQFSDVSNLVLNAVRESGIELIPECVLSPKDLSCQSIKVHNVLRDSLIRLHRKCSKLRLGISDRV